MRFVQYPEDANSEHPLEVNVLKGPKHWWSLHDSTFMPTFCSSQTKSDVYDAS